MGLDLNRKYRRAKVVVRILGFSTYVLVGMLLYYFDVGLPWAFLVGWCVGMGYQWAYSFIGKARVIEDLDGLIEFIQKPEGGPGVN